jgi:uncharacterized protein
MKLIKEINPSKTALSQVDFKSGQLFRGEGFLKYDDLPRVCTEVKARIPEYATDTKGVQWQLTTLVDELHDGSNDYRVKISLHFRFPLECQRCLEVYEEEFKTTAQFIFKDTAEEVDDFPLDNDEEDALLNSHQFDLISLFEDEIFLNLPMIPKHAADHCQAGDILISGIAQSGEDLTTKDQQISSKNPFSSLKNFKFDA